MDLRTYIAPLLRWWWLIIAATLIAGFSSYMVVRQQPDRYQSLSTLMIGRTIDDPNPNSTQFFLTQQLAETYADMAQRDVVRKATMDELELTWLPEYSVQANSPLIEIVVVDTSPERAQAVATELANQLITLSPSGIGQEERVRQEFVNDQLTDLQSQMEATQEELAAKQTELGELFSASEIAETQNQIDALSRKFSSLQSNYAALLSNTQQGAINALTIIEPASLPTRPMSSSNMMTVVAAAAVGFVLAAGAAYLLEYLDDTIKRPEDVTQITNLPVLTGIARVDFEEEDSRLITITAPRSPTAESFRSLRTSVQFANVDNPNRILLVTSSNPGEGKSFTAANLALVIAQAGHSVLLIDADLRRPTQNKIFGLSQERGLTSLLLEPDLAHICDDNTSLLEEFIQPTDEFWLQVLTSGPIPHNPSELLGSDKMRTALNALATRFDYLVVDSSPTLAVTDSVVISTLADGVVVVVVPGETRRNHLKQTMARLNSVNANVIGITLNRYKSIRGDNYYYYQSQYYGHDDDAEQKAEPEKRRRGFGRFRRSKS